MRGILARIKMSRSRLHRLDDVDYNGHSLAMLRRIAAALHMRLEVRLVPDHEAA